MVYQLSCGHNSNKSDECPYSCPGVSVVLDLGKKAPPTPKISKKNGIPDKIDLSHLLDEDEIEKVRLSNLPREIKSKLLDSIDIDDYE